MPCPKRKTSKKRRDQRSANHGLEVQTFTHCANSGSAVMPHTVCLESGYYKGVKVMVTKKDRQELRGKKRQARQEHAQKAAAKDSIEAESVKKD